jgi:hypothetical protein
MGISTAAWRPFVPIAVRVAGMAICGTVPGRRAVGMVYVVFGESGPSDGIASVRCDSGGGITFNETIECCADSSRYQQLTLGVILCV